MYKHVENQQNINSSDSSYQILQKYIVKNYLSNKKSLIISANSLVRADSYGERAQISLLQFLQVANKYLDGNPLAQESTINLSLGQNINVNYLNGIEKDEELKDFEKQIFLNSMVGINLLAEKFKSIKSNDEKRSLIKLALQYKANPMKTFGINFSYIKRIFGIQEIEFNGESLDNLGSLNQSLEQEYIDNNAALPAFDLSNYKKHILATYLFVQYTGDNIFDLFGPNEIAKLGGDEFIKFCYNQKYGEQCNKKLPKLEKQIRYTKEIALSSTCATSIAFLVLLFVLNFVAFNPLSFIIAPIVGIAVGGLTGKHLYDQKQKLNPSVEITAFDNFRTAYNNEIKVMELNKNMERNKVNTEGLDISVNKSDISNSDNLDKNIGDNKPRTYLGNPFEK